MPLQRLRVGSQGQTYQLLEFGVYMYTHTCAYKSHAITILTKNKQTHSRDNLKESMHLINTQVLDTLTNILKLLFDIR